MKKIDLDIVEKLMNYDKYTKPEKDYILYTDTDSLFIHLLNRNNLQKIPIIEEEINNKIVKQFGKLHNISEVFDPDDFLPFYFKNEMVLKNIILYKKKKYLAIIEADNGELIPEIKGLEGKKATSKFIEEILNDLIGFLKEDKDININEVRELYHTYVNKILDEKISFEEKIKNLAQPVNISKKVENLKTLSSMHKGTIIFDKLINEYWNKQVGKGFHIYVKLKEETKIEKSQEIDEIISYMEQLGVKIKNKSVDDLIKDITIPDEFIENEEILSLIKNYFDLNYTQYISLLRKKFIIFYYPIAGDYLYLFEGNRKYRPNLLLYSTEDKKKLLLNQFEIESDKFRRFLKYIKKEEFKNE